MNCPYCESSEIRKKGFRKLADGRERQRYQCGDCGKMFSHNSDEDTPDIHTPTSSYEEKQGFINITCASNRMLTVEEVLDQFGVDEDDWRVDSFKVKTSEGYRKDRQVRWVVEDGVVIEGDVTDTGKMLVVPLYHIEVKLVRRTEEIRARQIVEDFLADAKKHAPKYPKIQYPNVTDGMMYEIAFPDLHFGRLTWHEESGADYDIEIARDYLLRAVEKLLRATKFYPVKQILIPFGNDYFNVNSKTNATAKGTPQQEDTRWQKTFRKGKDLAVEVIDWCSSIAPVDVLMIPGNHDEERLFYLGETISAWYSNNPNVNIDNRAVHRKYYKFGQNLVGFAHGADEKLNQLPMLMAHDVPELWASTTYREYHTGDKHKTQKLVQKFDEVEVGGVIVRIIPSLVEFDAWTYNSGYMGNQMAMGFMYQPSGGLAGIFPATPD